MRLLNITTLEFRYFHDPASVPPYVIASHRWADAQDETTFKKFRERTDIQSAGHKKVEAFCEAHKRIRKLGNRRVSHVLGHRRDCDWLWIDTACIDKTDSAELTRSINSMFKWYRQAQICYAYLSDVHASGGYEHAMMDFTQSCWFSRGWTLQELLAPKLVVFLSSEWDVLGHKCEYDTCNSSCSGFGDRLNKKICNITGIASEAVRSPTSCLMASADEKKRWAANRVTTEPEDRAYCMMGLLGVYLPLIYGEGEGAWRRLQREVDGRAQREMNRIQASYRSLSTTYEQRTGTESAPPADRPPSITYQLVSVSYQQRPATGPPLGVPSSNYQGGSMAFERARKAPGPPISLAAVSRRHGSKHTVDGKAPARLEVAQSSSPVASAENSAATMSAVNAEPPSRPPKLKNSESSMRSKSTANGKGDQDHIDTASGARPVSVITVNSIEEDVKLDEIQALKKIIALYEQKGLAEARFEAELERYRHETHQLNPLRPPYPLDKHERESHDVRLARPATSERSSDRAKGSQPPVVADLSRGLQSARTTIAVVGQ